MSGGLQKKPFDAIGVKAVITQLRLKAPVEDTKEARVKRKDLFEAIGDGSKFVEWDEIMLGMGMVLRGYRVYNFTPVLRKGFNASKDFFKSDFASPSKYKTRLEKLVVGDVSMAHSDDCMEPRELKYLLCYLRHYFDLWFLLQKCNQFRHLDLEEFYQNLPFISIWGVEIDDPESVFHQHALQDGKLNFESFADWAIRENLLKNMFKGKIKKNIKKTASFTVKLSSSDSKETKETKVTKLKTDVKVQDKSTTTRSISQSESPVKLNRVTSPRKISSPRRATSRRTKPHTTRSARKSISNTNHFIPSFGVTRSEGDYNNRNVKRFSPKGGRKNPTTPQRRSPSQRNPIALRNTVQRSPPSPIRARTGRAEKFRENRADPRGSRRQGTLGREMEDDDVGYLI